MLVFETGIDQLIPSPRILRKNDGAVNRMLATIKEYGMPIPILGRHRGDKIEIVDGHLRVKAARKLGMTTIPVVFCDDRTEAQVKGFRLLVNRSATWATWADELVALELADLDALDFDLSLTGFDPFEIDEFFFPGAADPSANEAPELPKTAVTQLGDLWICDSHRRFGMPPDGAGQRKMAGRNITLETFIIGISNWGGLGRPVLDQTGLTGKYDYSINWTPDPPTGAGDVADATGPSFQAALINQLGLKLVATKGPSTSLIIDRVDRPSEN